MAELAARFTARVANMGSKLDKPEDYAKFYAGNHPAPKACPVRHGCGDRQPGFDGPH